MKDCKTCCNRFFCPSYGQSCAQHDDEDLFWLMLCMHLPEGKVKQIKKASKAIRDMGEENEKGYR